MGTDYGIPVIGNKIYEQRNGKLVETPLQFGWIWVPDRNRALHRNNPKQECALDCTCNI